MLLFYFCPPFCYIRLVSVELEILVILLFPLSVYSGTTIGSLHRNLEYPPSNGQIFAFRIICPLCQRIMVIPCEIIWLIIFAILTNSVHYGLAVCAQEHLRVILRNSLLPNSNPFRRMENIRTQIFGGVFWFIFSISTRGERQTECCNQQQCEELLDLIHFSLCVSPPFPS